MTETTSTNATSEIARPNHRDPFWDQIDQVFQDLHANLPSFWGFPALGESRAAGLSAAPIDVLDLGDNFEIRVDLPGIPKEKVDLRVTGETVQVSAQQEQLTTDEGRTYLRRERAGTGYHRQIELPEPVRPDEAKGKFENGVLTITVPKAHPVKERRVSVG